MCKLNELFNELNKLAPIELSKKMVEAGDYDNSGILIDSGREVKKILFSLDLSEKAVKRAKALNVDTIVTHHPAIYYPIKSLSVESPVTAPVIKACNLKMNVISMHLNLDLVKDGIDSSLAYALGGEDYKMIDRLNENDGYGKEFSVTEQTFSTYLKGVKKALNSSRVIAYGNLNEKIKTIATFCGGGAGYIDNYLSQGKIFADVVVSSDMPHHVIRELVEKDKKVIMITHYSAENVGFKRFFENSKCLIDAEFYFFEDKRFM